MGLELPMLRVQKTSKSIRSGDAASAMSPGSRLYLKLEDLN